jgi:hypothetical protein
MSPGWELRPVDRRDAPRLAVLLGQLGAVEALDVQGGGDAGAGVLEGHRAGRAGRPK